jgi:hypothetical protein
MAAVLIGPTTKTNQNQFFDTSQAIKLFIIYYFKYVLIHFSVLWDPVLHESCRDKNTDMNVLCLTETRNYFIVF